MVCLLSIKLDLVHLFRLQMGICLAWDTCSDPCATCLIISHQIQKGFVCCRSGRCPARHMMQKLLPLVQSGQLADATLVITHRLPMSEGVNAYQLFDQKKDGMIKCVLDPWA